MCRSLRGRTGAGRRRRTGDLSASQPDAQTLYRYETASSFAVDFVVAGDAQVITAGDESYVLAETWHRSIYSSVTAIVFAQDPGAPDRGVSSRCRSTATSSPSTCRR